MILVHCTLDFLDKNMANYNSIKNLSINSSLCKAWVNFNGIGTIQIRAAYNISTITDFGVGSYRMNFTTPMSDTNYSAVLTAWQNFRIDNIEVEGVTGTNAPYYTQSHTDSPWACMAVFK